MNAGEDAVEAAYRVNMDAVHASGLSWRQRLLAGILALGTAEGHATSLDELTRGSGWKTTRTVQRHLAPLEQAGWVKCTDAGYLFTIPGEQA